MERADPAELDLPAAQENDVRRQIAPENEQAIGDTERPSLPRQKPHRPLQCRVAGQQDADGGVQGEDGKADWQDEPGLHLTQQHRQDAGHAPHGRCVDQIILVGHQVAEQIAPHGGGAAVDFDCPPIAGWADIKGVGVHTPQAQRIETGCGYNGGQGAEDTAHDLRPAPVADCPNHGKQSGSLGQQGVGPQGGHIGKHQGPVLKGKHEHIFQVGPVVPGGEGLPHDPAGEGAGHQVQDEGGDLHPEPGDVQPPEGHQLQKERPNQPLIFHAKQLFGGDFKAHFHHAGPPGCWRR